MKINNTDVYVIIPSQNKNIINIDCFEMDMPQHCESISNTIF